VYNLCSERLYDASLFEGKVCVAYCFICPPLLNISTFIVHIRHDAPCHQQRKIIKNSVVLISGICWRRKCSHLCLILLIHQSVVDVFERSFSGLKSACHSALTLYLVMSNLKPCSTVYLLVYYSGNILKFCAYFRWPASHLMIIIVLQYNLSYHFAIVRTHGWRRI